MQINILGFGNMGQAIAGALVKNNFQDKIFVSDKSMPTKTHQAIIKFDVGFKTLPRADVVIVAVKPQDIFGLANQIAGKIGRDAVLISIAAGVPIKKLAAIFNHKKIIRMMPNLGLAVGQGIAAWKSGDLSMAEKKNMGRILNKITENFEVNNESLIDAVTAVSGSGPAYFFFFADALTQAAKNLGLSPAQSRLLVEKTMSAAAKLQQGQGYGELIEKVRSKKGTTDAALNVFNKKSMDKIIEQAVRAAYSRAKELSNG